MRSAPAKSKRASTSRGGRPSLAAAEKLEAHILDAARDLFFRDGYGALSIERLAHEARISKRTFYSRFKDKPDLFRAVVHRVIKSTRPPDVKSLFKKSSFEDTLHKVAEAMLHITLSPHLVALHRLLLAEAPRFPELVQVVYLEGTRSEALARIAELLKQEAKAKKIPLADPAFAAEQFMMLIMGVPQRRAMGLDKPMATSELKEWTRRAILLFLKGFHGGAI